MNSCTHRATQFQIQDDEQDSEIKIKCIRLSETEFIDMKTNHTLERISS